MNMHKFLGMVMPLIIVASILAGCRDNQPTGDGDDPGLPGMELTIGVVPEINIFRQLERYEPLAAYLSTEVGVKISLVQLITYENILDKIEAQDLDGAFLGSFSSAVAISRMGARPLARPQFPDGTSTYHGLIFTRKDSGITSAEEMQGKTFVFADKGTTAGWLLPLHYFQEHGITDPETWFDELYYAGTHEDAILDVLKGRADIGAAKNTIYNLLAEDPEKGLLLNSLLSILATSPPVPANALLVCPGVENSLQEKLSLALISMHLDKEGREALHVLGVEKFIKTSRQDYQPVFDYAAQIGLDLSTYSYNDDFPEYILRKDTGR